MVSVFWVVSGCILAVLYHVCYPRAGAGLEELLATAFAQLSSPLCETPGCSKNLRK